MKILRGLLAVAAFFLCLIFGAGGGCLIGIFGLGGLEGGGQEVWGLSLAIVLTIVGIVVGVILGAFLAVQVWRSFRQ